MSVTVIAMLNIVKVSRTIILCPYTAICARLCADYQDLEIVFRYLIY